MLKSNLLATKFHRPALPSRWVSRPHLNQLLHEGLACRRPLTLVSAPAGFGKTTCITEWLNTLEELPVAWLSLDAADDDPGRFFAYFIAALQKIDANLGQEVTAVLLAGQLPPGEVISTALINDILAVEERFLLVLDDFHVIQDRAILQVLETIITNPPPRLHLVLLTREDPPLPLARLRANGQLTEIRAKDLRFTVPDAARFLNEVLALSLPAADVAALEAKTEGWIVGLQLAGLSVRDRIDPADFITNLSGSHRFILDYLTEQVLNQQLAAIQQFLLQTSILDKLTGELCDAITGRDDGRSRLNQLFNANLFLIPLDDEQQWYRYHHLFADLLRARQQALGKAGTAVLHQRASHWYAQAGMTSPAIEHALAAEDFGTAVALLENHAMPLIMQGYVKTVNGWVEAIPKQWQSQSPRTHLALAWMHLLRGAYAQTMPYLERLRATLGDESIESETDAALKADWLVMRALVLYMQGQPAASEALAERALALAPEDDDRVRSLAQYALGSIYWLRGNYAPAIAAYRRAIQLGRAAENLVAEIMSTISLAVMAFEHGQLHLAYEIAAPIDERGQQSGSLPPISAVVYGVLGEVYLQWDERDKARQHIQRSLHLSRLGGYNTSVIFGHVTLSRLAQIEGDLETAAREIQTAVDLLPVELPEYVRQEVTAQQVNLYLARQRPAAAELALQGLGYEFQGQFSYPDLISEAGISYSSGLLYNSSLRVLINGRSPGKLKAGIELATRLIDTAVPSQQIPVALETYLLRARMYAASGNDKASRADYRRALALAEPEGFIGIFLEQGPSVAEALTNLAQHTTQSGYIQRILAAFARLQPPETARPSNLIEPLSDRELEVLRLMADGLKYKEIAGRLFISLNTVRYHVKALYGKLNVNNRTQAIAAARQLQIL